MILRTVTRFLILILVVSATVMAALSSPRSTDKSGQVQQHPNTGTENKRGADSKQHADSDPRTTVNKESAPDVAEAESRQQENTTSGQLGKGWDKFLAAPEYVFSGAVALFTLALVGIGWYQGFQLNRTVAAMQEAERAWVGVTRIDSYGLAVGKLLGGRCVILNSGRSPALEVFLETGRGFFETPPLSITYDLPGTGSGPLAIFPGQTVTSQPVVSGPISPEDHASIISGKKIFVIGGRIRYKDTLGRPHTTGFGASFDPVLGGYLIIGGLNHAD